MKTAKKVATKKSLPKKKSLQPEIEVAEKKRSTIDVSLTKMELIHLRDLFSILLPVEMKETVSQKLAQSCDRVLVEASLWQKISSACKKLKVGLNENAPDFVVTIASTPSIGVFEVAHDPNQLPGSEDDTEEPNALSSVLNAINEMSDKKKNSFRDDEFSRIDLEH